MNKLIFSGLVFTFLFTMENTLHGQLSWQLGYTHHLLTQDKINLNFTLVNKGFVFLGGINIPLKPGVELVGVNYGTGFSKREMRFKIIPVYKGGFNFRKLTLTGKKRGFNWSNAVGLSFHYKMMKYSSIIIEPLVGLNLGIFNSMRTMFAPYTVIGIYFEINRNRE